MTPSHYRLQLMLATGSMTFWLGMLAWAAYRQAWVDAIAQMMERGR